MCVSGGNNNNDCMADIICVYLGVMMITTLVDIVHRFGGNEDNDVSWFCV